MLCITSYVMILKYARDYYKGFKQFEMKEIINSKNE